MIIEETIKKQSPLREAITRAYRQDETTCVSGLLASIHLTEHEKSVIQSEAKSLVAKVRHAGKYQSRLDTILEKYDLSSDEGIALMCVAEALLRIPDSGTVDKLLQDKLTSNDWLSHLESGDSLFSNAVTWSLMLTGKLYAKQDQPGKRLSNALKSLTQKSSGLAVRPAVRAFMKFLGKKFVMGETISEALKRAKKAEAQGYRYSYDMLGEAAHTADDAKRYYDDYASAITAIGERAKGKGPIESPGISIKLSALHPRYEVAKHAGVMTELVPRVKELTLLAKKYDIGLTVDAEEADRLELSLDVVEAVFKDDALNGWEGFGLAVQSYQKRAPFVIDWLADLSRQCSRKFMIRLIKGAYWDAEIKRSQELGLEGYPVFTRKNATDVSFIACAKKIIDNLDAFYPQFATHNAHSIATVLALIGDHSFEFQCLHGMGQKLYDHIVGLDNKNIPCRIYAPVGSHKDLLGYLMRRLLENGANTSFVNLISHAETPLDELLLDPIQRISSLNSKPHPKIPLPAHIYGAERKNSSGIDVSNIDSLRALQAKMKHAAEKSLQATPLVSGRRITGEFVDVVSPSDVRDVPGNVSLASQGDVELALSNASKAFLAWSNTPVNERAEYLMRAAALLEERAPHFIAIASREAGKTIPDAISEVREAVDFCRYYAVMANKTLSPVTLPGPTGESNQLFTAGRGVIACISPWNFPLAIFIGQVVASLVAGNTVIAKPAGQTPLIAYEAVRLLHEAGIPGDVLHFLPGSGRVVGAALVKDSKVAGVVFTGSTETAEYINQTLANRKGAIVPFIAETGGQNAMIVDSSALHEQVVEDVIHSAFDSAGQRCSALRVLFVQDEIADDFINMLRGAMAELTLGDPSLLYTDVGPVIDESSKKMLEEHRDSMKQKGRLIYEVDGLPTSGHFFAPCAFEIESLEMLTREVFGPILHVIRYKAKDLPRVIQSINDTGYGLTLGVHSRIAQTAMTVFNNTRVGNTYVNRNMIGAVVGVQPFGGMGLSGTGPKAGGPHYLLRLVTERTLSINTTAAGGNASLLTLEEGED